MSDFAIRPAITADIDGIAHLLVVSFYPRSGWLRPLWQWGIALDIAWRLREAAPRYACLVAVDQQQKPIATVEICTRPLRPWQSTQYPYIFNLAVHPHWRRQGIARQLLELLETIARDWGFRQIFIHVLSKNQPAYSLYQQVNYTIYRQDRAWHSPTRLLLHKKL